MVSLSSNFKTKWYVNMLCMEEEIKYSNPRFFDVGINGITVKVKVLIRWKTTYICLIEKNELFDPLKLFGAFGFSVTEAKINDENHIFFYAFAIENKNTLLQSTMENVWDQIRSKLFAKEISELV